MAELKKNILLRSVSELLLKHDCVIIPGLGGFVATRKPAMISEANHTVLPPHKALSFNSQLQTNDGLFYNYAAQKLSVTYNQAEAEVKELVAELNKTLSEYSVVAVPSVGKLKLNADGKTIFSPVSDTNLLTESFGLKAVTLPQIQQKNVEPIVQFVDEPAVAALVDAALPEAETETNTVPLKKRNRFALYSIAAILIAVVGLSQVLIFNAQKENISLSELSIGNITHLFNTKPEIKNPVPVAAAPALLQKAAETETATQPRLNEQVTATQSEEIEKGYYIISGSFKDFDNAQKNVKRFKKKGMDARIIPTENNYYRVAIYVSEQPSDVAEKITTFRKLYSPKAWVMHNI
jgi:nucleoid DNA-binding protein